MRKRYKVILNVEVDEPETPYPAGGDYTHLNRIDGIVRRLTTELAYLDFATITLDKVIEKPNPEDTANRRSQGAKDGWEIRRAKGKQA